MQENIKARIRKLEGEQVTVVHMVGGQINMAFVRIEEVGEKIRFKEYCDIEWKDLKELTAHDNEIIYRKEE